MRNGGFPGTEFVCRQNVVTICLSMQLYPRSQISSHAKSGHCALARANRVFGTDAKRIRTKNTVMDKSKSSMGWLLYNIATLQPRGEARFKSSRTSGNALEQRQHALDGFAIRRVHEKHTVQPRLREYGLFLAEGAPPPFAMVGARAAGAHAAEGLVLLGDVPYAVIQSDPAGNRLDRKSVV